MHTCGSLQRQAELFEFEASQGYTVRSCLKIKPNQPLLAAKWSSCSTAMALIAKW